MAWVRMLAIFALSTLASYNEYNCPDECGLYAPGDKVNEIIRAANNPSVFTITEKVIRDGQVG